MKPIYVIGSSNTDMVVQCDHLPAAGETVLGGTFFMNPGGKGANQAVASARLGGDVTFIANVGDDLFGKQAIEHFQKEGIHTAFISLDSSHASGVALINVDKQGENIITVAPGANSNLQKDQIAGALESLSPEGIILIQLEIPRESVAFAIIQCRVKKHQVILNPAPAQSLSPEIYKDLFLITPNESEAELLTGIPVTNESSAREAAKRFKEFGVNNIIITLGSKGVYLLSETTSQLFPAPSVVSIDSTAAGDCFNGALAVMLSEGLSLEESVSFAVKAASLSVTRLGAQSSMPYRKELIG